MDLALTAGNGPRTDERPVTWARIASPGGGHGKRVYHAWRGQEPVCHNAGAGGDGPSTYTRERQPLKACRTCVKLLGA